MGVPVEFSIRLYNLPLTREPGFNCWPFQFISFWYADLSPELPQVHNKFLFVNLVNLVNLCRKFDPAFRIFYYALLSYYFYFLTTSGY